MLTYLYFYTICSFITIIDNIFILIFLYSVKIKKFITKFKVKLLYFKDKLIINLPFFIFFLLFCLYIKNPLLHFFLYNEECKSIILYLILNFFLIKIFKNFFSFFNLNKIIFLFILKVYQFLIFYPPILGKHIYSQIYISYHPSVGAMIHAALLHVEPVLRSVMYEARREMMPYSHQVAASNAICEAIPNVNNQWHLIFVEHRDRYAAQEAY